MKFSSFLIGIFALLFLLNSIFLGEYAKQANAQTAATISLNASTTFQTMTGWEATSQAGQDFAEYPLYRNTLLDLAVNDLGINRIRLEIRSSVENSQDIWTLFNNGQISSAENRCLRYSTVNDNNDPNVINSNGFKFSSFDHTIDNVILPLKQVVEARGEKLYINVNYVAFTSQITGSGCSSSLAYHHSNADEYAEFVLAAYLHMQSKYGFVPDAWEVILEPDNVSQWDGSTIGNAVLKAAARLEANGFTPRFIAPSNTNMGSAISYFDAMANVLGSSNVTKYVKEFSYHRYGGVSETPA